MEADEILLQKDWSQLTDAEKALIAEIADDEATYSSLRSFLLQSARLPEAAPAIPETVKQGLLMELAQRQKPRRKIRLWMTAAAAASVLAALMLWRWTQRVEPILPPANEVVKQEEKINIPQDTLVSINTPRSKQEVAVKRRLPEKNTNPRKVNTIFSVKRDSISNIAQKPVKQPVNDVAMNTSVKGNMDLLKMVVEVY
jgi:hypothetical protein